MARKKEIKDEIQWDKKKIILFSIIIFILLFGGFLFKAKFLDKPSNLTAVKGISTQNLPALNIKKNIQAEIDNLKNEAQGINVAEIASSSPQVQKVLNDLKGLKDLPKNQFKTACEKVCSSL